MELVIFFTFVAVMVGLLFYAKQWSERVHTSWEDIADDLGLTYGPESDELSGYFDGVGVGAYLDVRGTGKNRRIHTVVYAELFDILPPHMTLHREGVLSKIEKHRGLEDFETGDEEFDRRFVIEAADTDAVGEFFSEEKSRHALLELSREYPETRIVDGILLFDFTGKLVNQPRFETAIRFLVECARELRWAALDDEDDTAEEYVLNFSESDTSSSEDIDLENKWES